MSDRPKNYLALRTDYGESPVEVFRANQTFRQKLFSELGGDIPWTSDRISHEPEIHARASDIQQKFLGLDLPELEPYRVALVGKRGSGKTTLAKMMCESEFHRMALADPVKDGSVAAINAVLVFLGLEPTMTRERLETDKEALRGMPQFVGSDLGRDYIGPDTIWLDRFADRINEHPTRSVVVDDVRFPNEVAYLREQLGFTIVRITRDEDERLAYLASEIRAKNPHLTDEEIAAKVEAASQHQSEALVDSLDVDFAIANTSIEALMLAARRFADAADAPLRKHDGMLTQRYETALKLIQDEIDQVTEPQQLMKADEHIRMLHRVKEILRLGRAA